MSLPIFVAQDKWQDFDDAWNELMAGEGPIDDLLTALMLAGEKKRIARCVPLVRQHVELLEGAQRHADAARLLGAALIAGGSPGELSKALLEHAEKAWGQEAWWQRSVELTGLALGNGDVRRAWNAFNKLRSLQPGTVVYHAGGWGAGEVEELRESTQDIVVRFQNGRRDHFPLGAAVEIFEPLPESDLRAQYFRDPEGLPKRAKKEPLEVLRAIAERYHGKATLAAIKNALAQIGIEGSAWTAWWRKARQLAENSEWFKVLGSGAKVEVRLLLSAADPVKDLQRQLSHITSLEGALERARAVFDSSNADRELEEVAIQKLEELAANESEELRYRLSAWLLVRKKRGRTPDALQALVIEALATPPPEDPNAPPRLWAHFQELPTTRDQELAADLLEEVYAEAWLEEASRNLHHAAPGMVRVIVDKLASAGRRRELAEHYSTLLARPLRAPHALVVLARMAEQDKLPGEFPPPAQRAQALLTLATHLWSERRTDIHTGRAHTRLVELLAGGKEPVLEKLLAGADPRALRSAQLLIQRGVEESIDNIVASLVFEAGPSHHHGAAAHFWKDDSKIWTTRTGLERRRAELRELRDVKMPENEAAIGRAAALGDISENAEWESAMEEKRNLAGRASQMEAELRKAALLEHAILSTDTVSPGTIVRYRESGSGEVHEIVILGPWDTYGDDRIVSYRAPLAQGLLGLHTGQKASVQLPGGTVDVEVLEIHPAAID